MEIVGQESFSANSGIQAAFVGSNTNVVDAAISTKEVIFFKIGLLWQIMAQRVYSSHWFWEC